jgi:hypothetical protein
MIRVMPRSVGVGLLANLMARQHLCCLARRIRQQAGSMMRPCVNTRPALQNSFLHRLGLRVIPSPANDIRNPLILLAVCRIVRAALRV